MELNVESFKYAVSKIDDGFVFEEFAKNFLSAVLDYNFVPVGGTNDKGIDGFQHIYHKEGADKYIYQFSTEKDFISKIENTISKLKKNNRNYKRFIYVTNRDLSNIDITIDNLYEKHRKSFQIYDLKWFSSNCLHSPKTINAYNIFVQSYFHEFNMPGKSNIVSNLDKDSRLYVFLRQQFDKNRHDLKLDNLLTDALILFSLEETDPDKNYFKTAGNIKESIKKFVKFDPKILEDTINERLKILSTKPRKINFHSNIDAYCLPYETRLEIQERNLKDEQLVETFFNQTEINIKKYFQDPEIRVRNLQDLISKTIHKIFFQQGLEFSNFIIHGESKNVIEKDLQDIIGQIVDESSVVLKNKDKVKTALLMSIRDIVYNGTLEQKKFLKCLSNTYMMMFMLQWEPKLSIYFESMASQMKLFVDNSILIPALSEHYLSDENKRHWNLLVGAYKAGISLLINETSLDELVSHFKMIMNKYNKYFRSLESIYLNDEYETLFIDEIMIRAYFYSKMRNLVRTFEDFIDNFVDPSFTTIKDNLIIYLKDIFGITYISNKAWDINVDKDDKRKLTQTLKGNKDDETIAGNDAEMILAIYHLRDKNNETSESGIFGYKTWWLSKDTVTYKAVIDTFGEDRFPVSCYIRPDFVYNYIALAPKRNEIEEAYEKIFPSLLGVNLSYHMPKEVTETIQSRLIDFENKPPVRVKQIIKDLSDKLKSDPNVRNRKSVNLYLDEELKKLNTT